MIRLAALLLTVLTGFSGLVYEVTWQRYLATLLGSHSEATAAVLGIFLGGLALGYALFGTVTRRAEDRARSAGRPARLLLLYGLLEGSIGVYALLFPLLFRAVRAVSLLDPAGGGGLGFAFDVGLAVLLVGPPSVLMGGTIPILTQALARSLADATRFHAFVYAFNTAGAFGGALAAGYWLVPRLGLGGVLVAMAVVNLAAGAAFVLLGLARVPAPRSGDAPGSAPAIRFAGAFSGVALLVGFAMMTVQTVLIRLGGLSLGATQFTFSMVVAAFVLCIALGSFAVSALPRIPRGTLSAVLWGLTLLLGLLYPALQDAPYWAHVLRSLFVTQAESFYPYDLATFLGTLAVIGLPVALSGAVLPLIFHELRRELGGLGHAAGRIYGWNTLGSLLGALLGGYALLHWLDLHHVTRLAVAALAAAAALATTRWLGRGRWVAGAVPLALALGAIALLPAWSGERLSSGLFRERQALPTTFEGADRFFASRPERRLEFYDDDPTTSVALKWDPEREDLALFTNGKPDSSIKQDYVTTALVALLPALLAERAERAFVIGYGTGVSAGEFAALESAREVVVAEISQGVLDAAALFDGANLGASRSERVRMLRSDAHRAPARSEGSFDVIASEPSTPWVSGVEMLFSREFLETARDRLAPGGVHAQWLHTYDTSTETLALALRTYAAVFEHTAVWYTLGTDLLLIGMRDAETALDLDRIAARLARSDFRAGFARAGIESLPELLAHELLPLGVVHAAELRGELHTLLHPRLSDLAARAFFVGEEAFLPAALRSGLEATRAGARSSLLARYLARFGAAVPDAVWARLLEETCEHRVSECFTLLARWMHDAPSSAVRERLQTRLGMVARYGSAAALAQVREIVPLFDVESDEPVPLAVAWRYTHLYSVFHHHATPFPRALLADLWRRCEELPAQREPCRRARAEAERSLGPLVDTPG
jgi:spermidine synthase